MTCIKTGARILFQDYNFVVPADIYSVGNTYVIRLPTSFDQCKQLVKHSTPTHVVINHTGAFWRTDLGIFVVRDSALAKLVNGEPMSMI